MSIQNDRHSDFAVSSASIRSRTGDGAFIPCVRLCREPGTGDDDSVTFHRPARSAVGVGAIPGGYYYTGSIIILLAVVTKLVPLQDTSPA